MPRLSQRRRREIAGWYKERDANRAGAIEDEKLQKRAKCRLRLWECDAPGCGKKLRVADDHLRAFHEHVDPDTGAVELSPFVLRTPVLVTSKSVPF